MAQERSARTGHGFNETRLVGDEDWAVLDKYKREHIVYGGFREVQSRYLI